MKLIGKLEDYPTLKNIVEGIHARRDIIHLPDGQSLFTKKFKNGLVYGIDFQGNRYVEQNVASTSHYAARAREGARIVWVIRLSDNQYVGRIDNGEVYKKE